MLVTTARQCIVATPSIGKNIGAFFDNLFNERDKTYRRIRRESYTFELAQTL